MPQSPPEDSPIRRKICLTWSIVPTDWLKNAFEKYQVEGLSIYNKRHGEFANRHSPTPSPSSTTRLLRVTETLSNARVAFFRGFFFSFDVKPPLSNAFTLSQTLPDSILSMFIPTSQRKPSPFWASVCFKGPCPRSDSRLQPKPSKSYPSSFPDRIQPHLFPADFL